MNRSATGFVISSIPDGISLVHTSSGRVEHICACIERGNPEPARRVAQTICGGCARLKDFPNTGWLSHRMSGRRELMFPPLPYIVVYQVKQEAVEISRIFHGAQDWP